MNHIGQNGYHGVIAPEHVAKVPKKDPVHAKEAKSALLRAHVWGKAKNKGSVSHGVAKVRQLTQFYN